MSIIDKAPKKILTLESKMPFGQYKDEDVSWVLEFDPQYLYWVWRTIDWLEFDVELEEIVTSNTFDDEMTAYLREELRGMTMSDIC